ncbi:MAG: ATP-binding protein [Oscillospiraceae bacterium]|nr:ATP-binding protein [Oscillospiraceae bacterium]
MLRHKAVTIIMRPKLILITGYLAAGKSVFARRLSAELRVPCIVKDTFKSALCDGVDVASREESSRFSQITFNGMLYIAERFIENGCPVILEGNFTPAGVKKTDEAGAVKALLDRYGCEALTYKFSGDTYVLYQRFVTRDGTPERESVNRMGYTPTYSEFDTWCRNLDTFSVGGEVVEADTTDFDAVEYGWLIDKARGYMREG